MSEEKQLEPVPISSNPTLPTTTRPNQTPSNDKMKEVTVLVAGQVDSSKSTTIGVLVHNRLDDGELYKSVDRLKHEQDSNHTSSVSHHYMIKDKKVVNLCNLCGHKKYLKHTLYGISGMYADYGMLLVNINRGITEMGIEHLHMFVHLNIPFIVVLTKLDLCQNKQMYVKMHETIHKLLKKVGRKGISLKVNKNYVITENYPPYIDYLTERSNIVPIMGISNRTGANIPILKDFLYGLDPRRLWKVDDIKNNVFHITSVYQVNHVGLVVAGIVKSKTPIRIKDKWFLGPYHGKFVPVRIKSIHNDIRQDVDELSQGESGCICIKFFGKEIITKAQFKKGMILTSDVESIIPNITQTFTAKILVLHHHTSITSKYQSVVHMGPIQQSAKITYTSNELLRTGNVAIVGFEWIYRPEYVEVGMRFFAREGRTRIAGEVTDIGITRDIVGKINAVKK